MTIVELTDIDAKSFLQFRKNQAIIETLLAAGVFNIHGGKAILNFNKDGVLMNIQIEQIAWHNSKRDDIIKT